MGKQAPVEWVEPEKPKFLLEMEARAAAHRPDQKTIRPVARKDLLAEAEDEQPVLVEIQEEIGGRIREGKKRLSFNPDDI